MSKRGRSRSRSRSNSPNMASNKKSLKLEYQPSTSQGSTPAGAKKNPNEDIVKMLLEMGEYEKNISRRTFAYAAYRKAAASLQKLNKRVTSGADARSLTGVGERIAQKIDEILATGKLNKLDEVRQDETNVAVKDLVRVSGIGPVFASKLYRDGIRNIDDLRRNTDKLNRHQQIGLHYLAEFEQRIPRKEMKLHEAVLLGEIGRLDKQYRVTVCGSYRRGTLDSGDIDILITHPKCTSANNSDSIDWLMDRVIKHLNKIGYFTDTIVQGDAKYMGVCRLRDELIRRSKEESESQQASDGSQQPQNKGQAGNAESSEVSVCSSQQPSAESQSSSDGASKGEEAAKLESQDASAGHKYLHRRIDILFLPVEQYPCALLHFTGPDTFNQFMRRKAQELGYTLSEHSIRRLNKNGVPGEALQVNSEKDIFDYVGMQYREPNQRSI